MIRFAELLMVGHGAALLLIFNARANDPTAVSADLKALAWWFFVGVIAAFTCAYFYWAYEVGEAKELGILETKHTRATKQAELLNVAVLAFAISAITFPLGMLSAITFLGPPAAVLAPTENIESPPETAKDDKMNEQE